MELQSHWEFLTVVPSSPPRVLRTFTRQGSSGGGCRPGRKVVIAWMWTAIDLIHYGREEMHGDFQVGADVALLSN